MNSECECCAVYRNPAHSCVCAPENRDKQLHVCKKTQLLLFGYTQRGRCRDDCACALTEFGGKSPQFHSLKDRDCGR